MTATVNAAITEADEWTDIVGLAVAAGAADPAAVAEACRDAVARNLSAVEALLESNLVPETEFLRRLASYLEWEWWGDALPPLPAALQERVPVRLAIQHGIFPVQEEGKPLRLLTFDPFNAVARQFVSQALGERLAWTLCARTKIQDALRHGYGVGADVFAGIMEGREMDDSLAGLNHETTVLDAKEEEASVMRFVNQIIAQALREHATDIHVEPLQNNLRIRYRVDGQLHSVPVPALIVRLKDAVISRLKIMAKLNISERRRPQDGRINLKMDGHAIDVRMATIPTVIGESVSLRLLGQEKFDFDRLQLDEDYMGIVQGLLAQPNGIVLVTGPTGSGKSTTLYTFLTHINTEARRIVTIEDPVEHKLDGVMQIAVQPEIKLTFATGLRSVLRGDPNVVMIGEMRDFETAEIAIRASLTGHLVFSTLHTNDAPSAVTRLIDMGVEPFLVANSVRAFLAQRLVRRICPQCKGPAPESPERLRQIGFPVEHADSIRKGAGCEACRNTGYRDRMAIMEICLVSPAMQDLISTNQPLNVLRAKAEEEGMMSLRQYGWRQVIAGKTTIEEVLRVTTADVESQDE